MNYDKVIAKDPDALREAAEEIVALEVSDASTAINGLASIVTRSSRIESESIDVMRALTNAIVAVPGGLKKVEELRVFRNKQLENEPKDEDEPEIDPEEERLEGEVYSQPLFRWLNRHFLMPLSKRFGMESRIFEAAENVYDVVFVVYRFFYRRFLKV